MLDNYTDETKPLFRLLQTPAFRFVLVYFNHYSLRQRLKEDLQNRFPEWPVAEADATKATYRELADTFYTLGKGFFFIDNFEGVLADPEKYTGLNLRRDKLAHYPIALICFISPGAQALIARDIIEKMPDLWSFRSDILDLKREITIESQPGLENPGIPETIRVSSLGGYDFAEKKAELLRLQKQIAETLPEEVLLIEMLLRQVKNIQTDLGLYDEAIETINTLLKDYVQDMDAVAGLQIDKGDLFKTTGKLSAAVKAYGIALSIVSNQPNSNNLAVVTNERLGRIYIDLGDLEKALNFFEQGNQLDTQLHIAYPDNVEFVNSLAISYQHLGNVQWALGNLEQALSYYQQYNQLEAQLQTAYPDNMGFTNSLAISHQNLGNVQLALGKPEVALSHYQQYNQLEAQLHTAYPDNVGFTNNLAISFSKLGEVHSALGNFEAALGYYQQYNKLEAQLHTAYPDNVGFANNLAISLSKLGVIYRDSLNDTSRAVFYLKEAETLWLHLLTLSPNHAEFKRFLTAIQEAIAKIESGSQSYG